jgi:hypothetical protein
MTKKLIQKHLLKGSREFELVDDAINVRIKTPLASEEYTVVLSVLDPEPVVHGSMLAFESVVNREALIELYLNKPTLREFEEFVNLVKQRAVAEDFGKPRVAMAGKRVDVDQLEESIGLLRTQLGEDDIAPFLDSLRSLKTEPQDPSKLSEVFQSFNKLGPSQGAVLAYAPYIVSLMAQVNEADE